MSQVERGSLLEVQARRARRVAETLVGSAVRVGEGSLAGTMTSSYAPEQRRPVHAHHPAGPGLSSMSRGGQQDQAFDPAEVPAARSLAAEHEFRRKSIRTGGSTLC